MPQNCSSCKKLKTCILYQIHLQPDVVKCFQLGIAAFNEIDKVPFYKGGYLYLSKLSLQVVQISSRKKYMLKSANMGENPASKLEPVSCDVFLYARNFMATGVS